MNTFIRASALMLGALALLVSACGGDDDAAATPDDGVVRITMTDNHYDPEEIELEAGQQVTFEFTNDGEVTHEAFIGDDAEQEEHEAEMTPPESALPGHDMEGEGSEESGTEHGRGDSLVVEPGETGTLEYMADESGSVLIGCHEPGHWASGMRATIEVT
jgi:uncharacterized cupredoxin-like copper-binding protein